jgi:predicted LPLAT superfamily acyltransferase
LGDLEAEPYAAQENPMGWALASWMRQRRETRVELRLRLMEKILRFVRAEEYQELLLDTVQSYYRLSRAEQQAETDSFGRDDTERWTRWHRPCWVG